MRRKIEKTIQADVIYIPHTDGTPTDVYLTADGAAALLTELRKLDTPLTRRAIEAYTTRDQLTPAGYLGGLLPLYHQQDIAALANPKAGVLRRYRRKQPTVTPETETDTDALSDPNPESL